MHLDIDVSQDKIATVNIAHGSGTAFLILLDIRKFDNKSIDFLILWAARAFVNNGHKVHTHP